MALNTFKCNCLTPLHFKGLTFSVSSVAQHAASLTFGADAVSSHSAMLTDCSECSDYDFPVGNKRNANHLAAAVKIHHNRRRLIPYSIKKASREPTQSVNLQIVQML